MKKLNAFMALALCATGTSNAAASSSWDVSVWGSPRAFTHHVETLADLVAERSGGEFTLNISYGELSPARENLDGIAAGKFEMAQFCAGYHPERNATLITLELPFLGVSSIEQEVALSTYFYQQPAVIAELAQWDATLLMPSPLPQYNIMGRGEAPATITNLRGLRIRATGGIAAALEALGAETVSASASETKDLLSNGEIDAVAFAPHAHMAFGIVEQANWWTTNLNPGTVHCPVVVNSSALAALSPEHRDILLASVPDALDAYVENYNVNTMARWGVALGENNITQVEFATSDVNMLADALVDRVVIDWLGDVAATGQPAQDLFGAVVGFLNEASGS
ncbi:MAG: C4-dicarboxylate ABC transporter substrate-binding protein [Pseudomonadota bacterium]